MSYKTYCPNCKDESTKPSLYVTPENGIRFCFRCRYYDVQGKKQPRERYFDIDAIRSFYTEVAQYYQECLLPEHVEMLYKRGLNDETIQRYRIGFAPKEKHYIYHSKIAKVAGLTVGEESEAWLGNRIVFPYIGNDGLVWDIRGRSIDPTEEVRYLSPKGSAFFRGADIVYNLRAFRSDTYVITEGEIKALLSQQYGIPAIAFPGMTSYRPIIRKVGQKRIICFDNQIAHRKQLIAAHKQLSYKIGTEDLSVATLRLRGEEKQDIDSYILRYGFEEYQKAIDSALPFDEWVHIVRY